MCASRQPSAGTSRSRKGCLACRQTRIKCDEVHPICGRCRDRSKTCDWPENERGQQSHRNPRSTSSCEPCRRRRIRCDGNNGTPCETCRTRGVECSFSPPRLPTEDPVPQPIPGPSTPPMQAAEPPSVFLPDIKDLLKLYFSTIHHFAYLSFLHEADFWDRYAEGKIPERLVLVMAANAMRFGGRPYNADQLAVADRWVSDTGDSLTAAILDEFGAIELMELVLCQYYDFLNGRYSRGTIMAGMAVRMMTFLRLHMIDESTLPQPKPLLNPESLRRLAWAIWFLDATLDGGNFGFSTIRDGAFTISLPCAQTPFLLHKQVETEHLIPSRASSDSTASHLAISAYMIRAMAARQALADVHARITRQLLATLLIPDALASAEQRAFQLLDAFPADLTYSRALYIVHKDQLPALVFVHAMRNTAFRHISLLRILAAPHLPPSTVDVANEREALIQRSKELSIMIADALQHNVALDPQIAMHAYNGIEVLLFQPIRQAAEGSPVTVTRDQIREAIRPLLLLIKDLAQVCELVALVLPEAINRMIQMGHVDDLTQDDLVAVLRKVHSFASADREFDFNESFWRYELSLARRLRAAGPQGDSPNDPLLEVPTSVSPNAIPSPSFDVSNPIGRLESLFAARSSFNSPSAIQASDSSTMMEAPFIMNDLSTMFNATDSGSFSNAPFPWQM